MDAARDDRIRLVVVGGFLGSGKTTWLRHQLHHGLMKGSLVVINEAAEQPVDDALLGRSTRLAILAGGCACCDGREALLALLRQVADARLAGRDPAAAVDHIVLETSGLADPAAIVDAIRTDPVLVHHVIVTEIVVAVDALNGLDQLAREALGRRQVEIADRLVVTKIDAAQEQLLKRLLATLASLNPGAALSGADMGSKAPLPDFADAEPEALAPVADSLAGPIGAATVNVDAIDWTAFSVWLSALLHARGEDIMRVKGVVRTPAGRLLVQSVRKIVQAPQILPAGEAGTDRDNTIVLIGRGFREEDLSRSLDYFARAG